MSNESLRACVIAGWLLCTGEFADANAGTLARLTSSLPDVPAPPQGEVQWVARSMRLNGLPMTLKTFTSRISPDAVAAFYESAAQRWGRHESLRIAGQVTRLNIRSSHYVVTVEARPDKTGSTGLITVSAPPESFTATLDSDFPRPQTTRIVNRQEYDDDGVEAEHLSLTSSRSVAIEADAFVARLANAGWQILRHERMQARMSAARRGAVIEAQRGAELALLTLQAEPGRTAITTIVVVWRKS